MWQATGRKAVEEVDEGHRVHVMFTHAQIPRYINGNLRTQDRQTERRA